MRVPFTYYGNTQITIHISDYKIVSFFPVGIYLIIFHLIRITFTFNISQMTLIMFLIYFMIEYYLSISR